MGSKSRSDDANVIAIANELVGRLSSGLSEATTAIQTTLEREILELRGDPTLLDLLHASVEGNVATVLDALHYDIPIDQVESPTAALEYARRLAQRGVPANALVRAYRLGHKVMLDLVVDAIHDADIDPRLGLFVFERISSVTFLYIDWISQQVVNVYEDERERWLENRSRVRDVRVTEILEGVDVDVDAMTTSLRYPLRKTHLALVLWFADDVGSALVRLERFLRELTKAMHTEGALFVAADRITGWGWIPLGADHIDDPVKHIRDFVGSRPDAPHVALGDPLPGLDGFRRSHHQARNAHHVAATAGSAPVVTAASDPGLKAAALVGADIDEAAVWVRETLGPLATDSEHDALLRETLRVFLQEGASYKSTAELVHLHFNSVRYRVQRAVARRGRPIDDDRLDVELALLVCKWFGSVVLQPNPDD